MSAWILAGGRVVDPASDGVRDVLIEGGRVRAVAPGLARRHPRLPAEDARGRWVLPGAVDLHVHFREPGTEGETIASGARAAAAGGVTTALAMPNTRPAVDSPARLRRQLARSAGAPVTVLHAAAVTVGQAGRRLAPLAALARAGAAALSDDGRPVSDAGLLRRALEASRRLGLPVLDHAEDPGLKADGVVNEGPASARLRVPGIPNAAEAAAAARDIELCRLTGGRLHLCHVSSRETVAAVRQAKRQGVPVTAEACPHHFALDDRSVRGPDQKMNPPLRSARDVEALLEGLADGTLDSIATDHAPHPRRAKARGLRRAPFGVIGLETLWPVCFTELVLGRVLSPRRLADALSAAPARVLGLKGKGAVAPGFDADLVVLEPRAGRTVRAPFESLSSNSPFLGRRLKGWPVLTVVRGRVVMRGGRVLG